MSAHMDILQRHFYSYDIASCRAQLAPDSAFLGAVFSEFPLAVSKHLQAGRIDNQVGN